MIQKLDVNRLLAEKKPFGSLEIEFEAESDLLDIPYVAFSSPVKALLSYEISDDGKTDMEGELVYRLKGLCSRCLKETEREIRAEAKGTFVPRGGKAEGEDYVYEGGKIDLREFLRDCLAFSLPSSFLCEDGCAAPDYKED